MCTALSLSSLICLFPFQLSSEQGKGQNLSSFNNCFSIHYTLLALILPLTSPQMKKITLIFKYLLSVWHYTLSPLLAFAFPFLQSTHTSMTVGLCTQLWAMTSTVHVRDHSRLSQTMCVALMLQTINVLSEAATDHSEVPAVNNPVGK